MDRKQESKVVKSALQSAGYDVLSVKHGRGTSAWWLNITLARPLELACEEHGSYRAYDRPNCLACCAFTAALHDIDRKATKLVLEAAGRRANPGDCYDGNTSVHFDA